MNAHPNRAGGLRHWFSSRRCGCPLRPAVDDRGTVASVWEDGTQVLHLRPRVDKATCRRQHLGLSSLASSGGRTTPVRLGHALSEGRTADQPDNGCLRKAAAAALPLDVTTSFSTKAYSAVCGASSYPRTATSRINDNRPLRRGQQARITARSSSSRSHTTTATQLRWHDAHSAIWQPVLGPDGRGREHAISRRQGSAWERECSAASLDDA
jgi:hypothetical protein